MKKHFFAISFLLCASIMHAQQDTAVVTKNPYPDFENWTGEQIEHWEDSVKKALYPQPVIGSIEVPAGQSGRAAKRAMTAPLDFTNSHVPDSYPVDQTKEVGEIPVASSVTLTGAVAYSVPIAVSPGRRGFQPQLSVTYNSLAGNGVMGVGWSVGGLSSITRVGRSIYYDNKSQGVDLTKNDAFALDGTRLVKLSETSDRISYETEQGLIKVTAHLSGDIVRYFEVSYPNGNKAVFGEPDNYTALIHYPVTSLTDISNNTIHYNYTFIDGYHRVSSITYSGGYVLFTYSSATRPDPVITYEGGLKVVHNHLLEKIECGDAGLVFRTYTFTYQTQSPQNTSMLTQIGCDALGKSLNPLRFYYGSGNTAYSFTKAETQLLEWYSNAQPGQLIVSKGKFDYGTDDDGLISLPNKNPYWEHFKHKTWFSKRENRYDNLYEGTEKIFLYAGLNSDWVSPMPNLTTEAGFIDVFCANTDGKHEEEVIKVNNTVSGNYDRLQFKVYAGNLYNGLAYKYTRTFNFSTVLTDAKGNKSVHPKFYYPGDFNGDGKMEVLAVSNHHPFGWTDKPGRCYLFDLDTGTKLYEGAPFAFRKEFVGTQQTDPVAAAQNSDRLFAFDYDGDGKTDICLVNDYGTYIYTFDVTGATYSVRLVSSYTALKKSTLEGRELLMGEFNGDGKPDFLLTTKGTASDWAIYYAKGNGQFERVPVSITSKSGTDRILLQDVNSDGLTDVIKTLGTSGFFTYLTKPGSGYTSDSYASFDHTGSVLVPTNINSRNYFHQLVALKDGKVTRYSYPRNDTKEKQLTGSVNSLGVVAKNHYLMLNEAEYYYTKGYGAVYPFENFHGPLSVPVNREQYVNGQRDEQMEYRYENAVIHKQGRGFCGFGKITVTDNIRGTSSTREFDPYNFGVLKSEDTHLAKTTNTWQVNVQWNKIAKITLARHVSLNKLTSQSVTSDYTYDAYGNMTGESVNYGGEITVVTSQTYYNSGSSLPYLIGQPLVKTVTRTRDGSSWIDKETINYNAHRLPESRITYTGTGGTQKTGETRWIYDVNGNVTSEKSAPYNVTVFSGDSCTYDASGRYMATVRNALNQTTTYADYDKYGNARTVTDHKGRQTTLAFDVWGRQTSATSPDGVMETVTPAWGGQGVYTVTKTVTGQPATVVHYDALGREIRKGNQRFDGSWQYVDNAYDNKGRLEKVSLPFKGSSPSYWNTYTYDTYDRPTNLTEASGKTATWNYNGLSVTETRNGIAVTKTVDASGALISVSDPGGTITYTLRPDGQPSSIAAPGGVVTSFGYDAFGRQTSIADPSAGTQTFTDVYSTGGVLTRTVKDANGKIIRSIFKRDGRIERVERPEFTTSYVYKTTDLSLLEYENSTNGTRIDYTYDSFDRVQTLKETVPDGKFLQKTYAYATGNVSSVQYETQNGTIGTENFTYAYGHNTEIKLNNTTSIWKLTEENALGQPTRATTGTMARTYGYTAFGLPTGRTAGSIQSFSYNFDVQKGNLLSRKDNTRNKTETFGYDHLNRLSSMGGQTLSYAANGNITQMPGVGTLAYGNTSRPYQVTMITPTGTAVPVREQSVTYTSYQRPNSITENGFNAAFTYNAAGDRVKMQVKQNNNVILSRYYIGKQYELDVENNIERLYLGGDAYSSPAVYVKENNVWKIYYICRDYLGSITHVANADGSLKQELSYDAWGRLRNPATHAAYAPGSEPILFLRRGYTGHEHLYWFGLVNMNARLYDAALGRFLSPDPYVQMPDFTQNFNRYSYCLNNPLVYVDQDGEFWHIVIGAIVGGVGNLIANWKNIDGFWDGLSTVLIGAGAGAATAATGGAGAGFWAVAGVSAGGGALVATNNDIVAQTGKNFSGFDNINWGQVGKSTLIGGVSGFAGGSAGYWAANSSLLVNNINSPVLRSAVVSPLASGAGHVAGGTTAGVLEGQSLGTAFNNSLNGLGGSMAMGGAIGIASTIGVSYANKVNPWTGKALNVSSSKEPTDFFKGTRYSEKVLQQMYEDNFHGFPESVRTFQQDGYTTTIIGGDGVARTQLHIPGSYKGYNGEFLFLKEPNGIINHRIFQPYVK